MAGLCAIVRFDRSPPDRRRLERMAAAATHRSGEGVDHLFADGVALAALSSARERRGALASSDRDEVMLAAEARLDGRDELRRALLEAGRPTNAGSSDAELVLAAYLAWGEGCADRLRGDFAFVAWDARRRRALCARDCFGVMPLCYRAEDGALLVASQAQQIAAAMASPPRLDEVAVADYLVDDSRDEQRTFFAGVSRLPPGSTLVCAGGEPRFERYWRPAVESPELRGEEAAARVAQALDRAVRRRLPADDPVVGVMMSGGLDSCSVAALAHRRLSAPQIEGCVVALTYAFGSLSDCDERRYSDAMAKELGLEVERIDAEAYPLLGDASAFRPSPEGPFQGWQSADRALCERLRERGGRVLLTGYGGDNLFAGSSRVFHARLRRGDLTALPDLARTTRRLELSPARAIYGFLLAPAAPRLDLRFRRLLGRAGMLEVPDWICPLFAARTGLRDRLARRPGEPLFDDPAREAQWRMIRSLESVGRASAQLSATALELGVEPRHPFLDRDLAELALSIAPGEHFGAEGGKLLLRRALRGTLPESVRQRRDKTRFGAYIRFSLVRERRKVEALLHEPLAAELGYVDTGRLRARWRDYAEGRDETLLRHIWYVLTLEMWLRCHCGDLVHGWRSNMA